ncbi:hypothetical protein Ade02nite_59750 [Paractinoplanes deccanensis]|uniref:Uncharacterized protein n=1 Tax=Paractinoplanes deccanensis TaxID=113561 RepID=A0ABQ3YBD3_9ACTN|nr:hypothetical protein Ade02nite_59750 [Actinoplanes deccanensis]
MADPHGRLGSACRARVRKHDGLSEDHVRPAPARRQNGPSGNRGRQAPARRQDGPFEDQVRRLRAATGSRVRGLGARMAAVGTGRSGAPWRSGGRVGGSCGLGEVRA